MRKSLASAVAAAVLALGLTAPGRAAGASFLPDGTFEFDPDALVKEDFEGKPPPGATVQVDEHALSGQKVLVLGAFGGAAVPVTLPKSRATYRITMWGSTDVVGDFEVSYSGRVDEVAALYPTGRVTSDGWIELAADHVRVDGGRATTLSLGIFSPNGAKVDAVEVVADGDASEFPPIPNAHCDGATVVNPCATGQLCVWNECRNVAGWVPPIPADRDDVTDYLAARMQLLFGPFLERTEDLPASLVFVEAMRNAEDRYTYWSSYLAGVRRLHDGHTTTSGLADFVIQNPRPLSFCAIEGDADLSHDKAPKDADYLDVLVSHVGADHNLGLKPGDRIVAVDGQHPIAWARSLLSVHWGWPTTSNHATFAELASYLRSLVSRYANHLDVVRCDAGTGTCGEIETISIADVPFDDPGAMPDIVTCDNRPLRHVPGAPVDHAVGNTVYEGVVAESAPGENIHGMEWESLDTTTGQDGVGPALTMAVVTWQSSARGVIMDHRTGFGGTLAGPDILWNFAQQRFPNDLYRDRVFAGDEQPSTADGMATFTKGLSDGAVTYCGSATPDTTIPVALLVTEDVSASDWLPQGLKGAPNAKIFGPFQTNGGFSTRYPFGYWLGLNYVMAVGDDFLPDGTTHNGRGVDPDVVVLPKQSDLLAGKDSVYEAALAWVRANLAP